MIVKRVDLIEYPDDDTVVRNQTGVKIRPYDHGGVGGIYYSNPGDPVKNPYMKTLVDSLEAIGYKRDISLRAHT